MDFKAPADHPINRRRNLELADLRELRFILREPGSGTRMATDAYFKQLKFRPDLRLELGSKEAVKEAVAGGLGVAVISSHSLQGASAMQGVCLLNVKGFPIESNWHVVHPRAKHLSPIAKVFQQHLLLHAQKSRTQAGS